MTAKALPILLLGGAAALMLAGKKRRGLNTRDWKYDAPPAPDEKSAFDEQNFVNIVFDGRPSTYYLGKPAADARVTGSDSEGWITPPADETLATWYTHVAYWGAYPYPAPYEIPPQCMAPELAAKLGAHCDPRFIPYRDAMIRIHNLVIAEGNKRGINLNARMGSQA